MSPVPVNKTTKLVLAILIGIVALGFVKNILLQGALSAGISGAAHAPVSIGYTDVSVFSGKITIRNLQVRNPAGFRERLMLDIPLVSIDADPSSFLQGRARFEEVRLNLKEVVVVKNKEGKLNIDAAKPTQAEKEASKKKAAQTKKEGKPPKLMIDKLTLSIGRVVYKDYTHGGEPAVQTFEINIKDRVYTHIEDPSAIVSVIMVEALTRTTLSRLAGLDVSGFKDGALGAISGGLGLVGDGAQGFEEKAKDLLGLFQ